MARKSWRDYPGAGSLQRCEEAAYALADADSEDDRAYYRARARFNAAIEARVQARLRELVGARRRPANSPALSLELPFQNSAPSRVTLRIASHHAAGDTSDATRSARDRDPRVRAR